MKVDFSKRSTTTLCMTGEEALILAESLMIAARCALCDGRSDYIGSQVLTDVTVAQQYTHVLHIGVLTKKDYEN